MNNYKDFDIKYKSISDPNFIPYPHNNICSTDVVIAYSNNKIWKIIPLYVLQKHLIVHDKLYVESDDIDTVIDISIIYSPYSNSISLFEKHLEIKAKDNDIILVDDNNELISYVDGMYIKTKKMLIRGDVYISKLHKILYEFRDCLYLKYDDIIDHNIKINNYGHGLLYTSKDLDENNNSVIKYIFIESKSYNIKNVLEYIESLEPKISQKNGIVIPSFKSSWIDKYPDTKIKKIN